MWVHKELIICAVEGGQRSQAHTATVSAAASSNNDRSLQQQKQQESKAAGQRTQLGASQPEAATSAAAAAAAAEAALPSLDLLAAGLLPLQTAAGTQVASQPSDEAPGNAKSKGAFSSSRSTARVPDAGGRAPHVVHVFDLPDSELPDVPLSLESLPEAGVSQGDNAAWAATTQAAAAAATETSVEADAVSAVQDNTGKDTVGDGSSYRQQEGQQHIPYSGGSSNATTTHKRSRFSRLLSSLGVGGSDNSAAVPHARSLQTLKVGNSTGKDGKAVTEQALSNSSSIGGSSSSNNSIGSSLGTPSTHNAASGIAPQPEGHQQHSQATIQALTATVAAAAAAVETPDEQASVEGAAATTSAVQQGNLAAGTWHRQGKSSRLRATSKLVSSTTRQVGHYQLTQKQYAWVAAATAGDAAGERLNASSQATAATPTVQLQQAAEDLQSLADGTVQSSIDEAEASVIDMAGQQQNSSSNATAARLQQYHLPRHHSPPPRSDEQRDFHWDFQQLHSDDEQEEDDTLGHSASRFDGLEFDREHELFDPRDERRYGSHEEHYKRQGPAHEQYDTGDEDQHERRYSSREAEDPEEHYKRYKPPPIQECTTIYVLLEMDEGFNGDVCDGDCRELDFVRRRTLGIVAPYFLSTAQDDTFASGVAHAQIPRGPFVTGSNATITIAIEVCFPPEDWKHVQCVLDFLTTQLNLCDIEPVTPLCDRYGIVSITVKPCLGPLPDRCTLTPLDFTLAFDPCRFELPEGFCEGCERHAEQCWRALGGSRVWRWRDHEPQPLRDMYEPKDSEEQPDESNEPQPGLPPYRDRVPHDNPAEEELDWTKLPDMSPDDVIWQGPFSSRDDEDEQQLDKQLARRRGQRPLHPPHDVLDGDASEAEEGGSGSPARRGSAGSPDRRSRGDGDTGEEEGDHHHHNSQPKPAPEWRKKQHDDDDAASDWIEQVLQKKDVEAVEGAEWLDNALSTPKHKAGVDEGEDWLDKALNLRKQRSKPSAPERDRADATESWMQQHTRPKAPAQEQPAQAKPPRSHAPPPRNQDEEVEEDRDRPARIVRRDAGDKKGQHSNKVDSKRNTRVDNDDEEAADKWLKSLDTPAAADDNDDASERWIQSKLSKHAAALAAAANVTAAATAQH